MIRLLANARRLLDLAVLTICICLSSDLILGIAQAQPQSCGGAAFATIGTKFYVQGGASSQDNLLTQFWALDLSIPWPTNNPSWTSLSNGNLYNGYHSAGFSSDNKTFISFGRDTAADPQFIAPNWLNVYDLASQTWTYSNNPSVMSDNSRRDFSVVTNPGANRIYILSGGAGPAGAYWVNKFNIYDPSSRTLTEITTPLPGPQNISTYSAVWSQRLNSMVVIGGQLPSQLSQTIYLYNAGTGAWSTQSASGQFKPRFSACAASNADGSLIAVFGGFTVSPGTGDANIYLLDTVNWAWTTVVYPGQGRGNSACGIIDDIFLVWGGFWQSPNNGNGVPTGEDALLLFSLSKRQWQKSYTPSAWAANYPNGVGNGNGTNPGGGSKNQDSGGGLSPGAIGGIVAGAVVGLLFLVALLLFMRRKRNRKNKALTSKIPSTSPSDMGSQLGSRPSNGPHTRPDEMMMVQHDPTRPSPPNTYHSLSYTPDSSDHNRPSVEGMLHHASYSGSLAPSTTHYIGPGDIDPRIGSFYGSGIVSGSGEFSGRQSVVSDSTVASSLFFPPPPPVNPKMGGSSVLHPIQEQPHAPFMLPNASSAGYSPAGSHSSANRLRYSDSHSTSQPSHFSSGGVPYYLNSGGTYYPPGSAPAPDQYHDDGGYGSNSSSSSKQYLYLSNQSLFSDGVTSVGNPQAYSHRLETELSPPTVPKRPLSGPQGGLGFGTMLMMGNDGNVPPGNPHTLPQHQSSFHAESQSPPPLSPGLERG